MSRAVQMDKLGDYKICGDSECSYVLSMATALDDFIAPDCRFVNIKKEQMVYVYSSSCQKRELVSSGLEVFIKFREDTVKLPTTDMDFYCH
ncbi:hypothetical protein WMY93_018628 [Mugilogobius chulae]|uniref:Uncharacterized protein n=1 Tax=Mugilogobius chulae TaxID=88201 RepID=A0AAW0NQY6_9GOBI